MKKLEILTDPNPILREVAKDVTSFDGEFQELIDNMIYTMRNSDGIGLAAPQVGELKNIIVAEFEVDDDSSDKFPLSVVVNPKIENISEEKLMMMEGCLSFPGKEMFIKRPKKIKIRGLDRWGKSLAFECDNLLSRVLQHENDHLNGVLMIDYIKPIKTIFVGNGSLGVPAIERMKFDPQFNLIAVVCSINKSKTSKGNFYQTEIEKISEKLKIPQIKVSDINNERSLSLIKKYQPELIIVADYNQILSEGLIKIPKFGILNIHPSLLPKYRGPSPIVSAVLAGEKKTGVSIIKINNKIDAGEILSQIEVRIKKNDTSKNLKKSLAIIGAALLTETVPYLIAGEIVPVVQNEKYATTTKRFQKSDGKISGKESKEMIDRMVRAFYPWPGVYQEIKGKKVFITKTHIDKSEELFIDMVKPEGKKEMSYKDFLNGYRIELLQTVDK